MSPERPLSMDSVRPTILDTAANMMIDANSGRLILQQSNGSHVLTNGNYATYTTVTSSSTGGILSTAPSSTMPLASTNNSSKVLLLEPNQLNDNYITSKCFYNAILTTENPIFLAGTVSKPL